jgi:hypothetical protein
VSGEVSPFLHRARELDEPLSTGVVYVEPADVQEKQKKQAIALLESFGVFHEPRDPIAMVVGEGAGFGWDGKSIATGVKRNATDILHDLAHWLVAPPSRRKIEDFGLGRGPDSGGDARRIVGDEWADNEEEVVSFLGIVWEAALGHNPMPSLVYQSWTQGGSYKKVVKAIKKLTRKGLLDDSRIVSTSAVKKVSALIYEADLEQERKRKEEERKWSSVRF